MVKQDIKALNTVMKKKSKKLRTHRCFFPHLHQVLQAPCRQRTSWYWYCETGCPVS